MPTVLEATGHPAARGGRRGHPATHRRGQLDVDVRTTRRPRTPVTPSIFEMLGLAFGSSHRGWKATTDHISTGGARRGGAGHRKPGLRRTTTGACSTSGRTSRSPPTCRPSTPRSCVSCARLWRAEAEEEPGLPVEDPSPSGSGPSSARLAPRRGPDFLPGGGPVSDESVPMLFGGFRITAVGGHRRRRFGAGGRALRPGDWNGGFALWVEGGRLVFSFQRAGPNCVEGGGRSARCPPAAEGAALGVSLRAGGRRRRGLHPVARRDPVGSTRFAGMLPIALQHVRGRPPPGL